MDVELKLLGGFGLTTGGRAAELRAKKAKALMAYLALHQDQPQPRDRLAAMLWEDRYDGLARQNLRQCLADIRRVLGDEEGCLVADGETVMLKDEVVHCDVEQFFARIEAPGIPEVQTAIALYRGRLLEGLNPHAQAFEHWLITEQERIDRLAIGGYERLIDAARRDGDVDAAIELARQLLRVDPVREDVHRTLMELLHDAGRSADALKQYQTCRAVLERQLGVPPEPTTHGLYQTLLASRRKRVTATPPPAGVANPGFVPELRLVTVVAIATHALAELLQHMVPAELDRRLAEAREAIVATLRHFTALIPRADDELTLAVFGVPEANGYEMLRGTQAALAVRDRLASLEPLRFGYAVCSGQAMARYTPDGRMPRVSGEPLAEAVELVRHAPPGELVARADFLASLNVSVERAPLNGAGMSRVLSVSACAEAGQLPFVGRRVELQQLRTLWELCRETGTGRGVLVRGAAGIGKSRLVRECVRDAKAADMTTAEAATHEPLSGAPTALAGLTKSLLGVEEDVADVTWFTPPALAHRGLDATDVPAMCALLDLEPPERPSAEPSREQLRATMRRVVAHVTRRRGLVVVVEDIHWADAKSLARIADLLGMAEDYPLLLVLTTRMEDEPLDPEWRGAILNTPLLTIDLGPLRPREARELAVALTDKAALSEKERLIERCVARSEGHPLFLEQLVQAALTSGARIPLSVHAIVNARLRQLDESAREALRAAAVLGVEFPLAALEHLLEGAAVDWDALLGQRLLRREGQGVAFTHTLIRESVYATLLARQRAALHGRAADWYAARNPVVWARHLAGAGSDSAAAACLSVARQELDQKRHDRALELVELARTLALGAPERAELDAFAARL